MPETHAVRSLLALDDIGERLERALEQSPADETEIVWLESRRSYARRQRSRIDVNTATSGSLLVRVLDLGRVGSYRSGSADSGEIAGAVRLAMAQSRVREPLPGLQHLPSDTATPLVSDGLFDPHVAALDDKGARALLDSLALQQENAHLHWAQGRVAVYNSRGVRRTAEVTSAGMELRTGRRPGAARACHAARILDRLDPEALLDEARSRHAAGEPGESPRGTVPVVFSPMATIALCDLLNTTSFSAKAYYDGTSFLREHVNIQVFDRRFNLRDDATDPGVLPFPFDLEGTAKRPVDLIAEGAPKTPTLDQRQAAVLGLPATAHAIGGNDARAQNLILLPGSDSETDLLAAAEGGLWVGWLDAIESLDPARVRFRCRARGVRRIEGGGLGASLADLRIEDGLLRAFSTLLGVGARLSSRLSPDGLLGGISAPAIAVAGVELGET